VFPISFAVLVASTDDAAVQHVLMDAFDQGIVNCQNFAKARAIITARMTNRKRGVATKDADYTVASLTTDIATATKAKDAFVREAQTKEGRLFTLLDGLNQLWKDPALQEILTAEGLAQRPDLAGTYAVPGATGVNGSSHT
jgi:hypothetical protein